MKEFIFNNKKIRINAHTSKISIDVETDNYKKKIVISDEDIKVYNSEKALAD